ncbi:hypothetical protein DPMN_073160 [Dreissena polymorpha]|uniref:Uncharacterized protein n=1 Tax=Dreissena polymorpha TaxID=45954 RepID=A0A9D4HDI8_DREPO|nr:hypothetical protein DPMN_073160 [Dreissena polymorpha]
MDRLVCIRSLVGENVNIIGGAEWVKVPPGTTSSYPRRVMDTNNEKNNDGCDNIDSALNENEDLRHLKSSVLMVVDANTTKKGKDGCVGWPYKACEDGKGAL